MLGLSSSCSALSVPPLHTPVPTRTTLEMWKTRLGGRGRTDPSPGAVLVPVPNRGHGAGSPHAGFCCFSVPQLGAGVRRWVAEEGHPSALGWRAEVGSLC